MKQRESKWFFETIYFGLAILGFLSFGSSAKPAFARDINNAMGCNIHSPW